MSQYLDTVVSSIILYLKAKQSKARQDTSRQGQDIKGDEATPHYLTRTSMCGQYILEGSYHSTHTVREDNKHLRKEGREREREGVIGSE